MIKSMKDRFANGTNEMKKISRRDIIKVAALGMAGACAGGIRSAVAAESGKKIPIALQLYTVRDDCKKDFDGTVRAVAKMGYDGVEFAASYFQYKDDPKGLKKLLDDCGLKCAGTHTGMKTLQGDELKKTVEFHKIMENKYLIVPFMKHKDRAGWEQAARELSEIAEKLKEHGMRTGYHAHQHDFAPMDGSTSWDIFFSAGSKDLVMQMDTGNCMSGGGDPIAILKKYPGRSQTIHLKEHFPEGKKGAIGDGDVNWKEVFSLCRTTAGTEWYIIEQETYPVSPLETAQKCLEGLKKLLD